jgi:hypothetical protein
MKLTALVFAFGALAACSSDNNGGSSGQPDAGSGSSAVVCGDGTCSASEVTSCSADCGDAPYCGDNTCNNNETSSSCQNDCGGGGQGSGSGSGSGSGTPGNCPSDQTACLGCLFDPTGCPAGMDQNTCLACISGGGGGLPGGGGSGSGGSPFDAFACTGGAADGTCDTDEMDLALCSDCM